jgi:hypothetical protein
MIVLSEDGYVRLKLETLLVTPLVHFMSGLDDDSPIPSKEGGSLAHIAGYTEWISPKMPVITLGWDWRLNVTQGKFAYERLGGPQCNIMLVDDMQRDLVTAETSVILNKIIDGLAWQEEVYMHIRDRYA